MENLANLLKHIYPDLDLDIFGAVQLVDLSDGLGPRISVWNDPRPQPTEAELLATIPELKRESLKVKIDEIAAQKIAALFGLPPKSNDLIIKQLNYSARVSELQETVITGGILSVEEQAELDAIKSVWTQIKDIRTHGKQLKLDVVGADPDTFDIQAGW